MPQALKIAAENAPVIRYRLPLEEPLNLYLKRSADLVLSSLGILLLLVPLCPLIALAVFLDSPGPLFFRQQRSARNEKLFSCLKFRTMHKNGEADERPSGPGDTRITRTGRFLRATHLDELPQLLNVFVGQMSLVGPRPHMLSDDNRYQKISSSYNYRRKVKPGLTGLAQVKGLAGHTEDADEVMERIRNDVYYINHWSFWLDTKILLRTALCFTWRRLK